MSFAMNPRIVARVLVESILMTDHPKCSGCQKPLEEREGIQVWKSILCSTCFIDNAGKFHRPLTPDQVALLKMMGRQLAGHLPPDFLEIILVGFWRRSTGRNDAPPAEEMALVVGEIQRLAAFSNLTKTMNLLKTWHNLFNEFVEEQEEEIRSTIKRLTDIDQA